MLSRGNGARGPKYLPLAAQTCDKKWPHFTLLASTVATTLLARIPRRANQHSKTYRSTESRSFLSDQVVLWYDGSTDSNRRRVEQKIATWIERSSWSDGVARPATPLSRTRMSHLTKKRALRCVVSRRCIEITGAAAASLPEGPTPITYNDATKFSATFVARRACSGVQSGAARGVAAIISASLLEVTRHGPGDGHAAHGRWTRLHRGDRVFS